mmetsp:Transcript_46497/g.110654  ORF Transcript_46497/g.110654 Transcript_46497/m.110654 type:complete len:428 (-) Transcript_46497:29-1312(-)
MGGGLAWGQGVRRQEGGRHRTVLTSGKPGFNDSPGFLWLKTAQEDAGLKRVLSWVLFFTVVYLLEPFSGVIAGTFVLSFVGNSVVDTWLVYAIKVRKWAMEKKGITWIPQPQRQFLALVYMLVVVNFLVVGTVVTAPQIASSWRYLKQVSLSDNPYVALADSIHALIGGESIPKLEGILQGITGVKGGMLLAKGGGSAPILAAQLQTSLKGYVLASLPFANQVVKKGSSIFYQFMLSLLFSFIVIWDKPALKAGVQKLGQGGSKVKFIYKELAPRISLFARLVGKSLEAQLLIATFNTILTTLGIIYLKISGVAFFSVLVFVCSFIPLAGVIMSTLPISIVALSESGLMTCLQVFMMVFVVHAVEAYFLNPRIYSAKLKLHPLMVLCSLYVTEHVLGIGALFLAVPVTVFATKVMLGEVSNKALNAK